MSEPSVILHPTLDVNFNQCDLRKPPKFIFNCPPGFEMQNLMDRIWYNMYII